MCYRLALYIIFTLYHFDITAQHTAYNILLDFESNEKKYDNQKFDLPNFGNVDFIAISLRLEGKDINNGKSTFSISNGQKQYELPPFSEAVSVDSDTFVSELIYLTAEEAGIWNLTIHGSDEKYFTSPTSGFLRVFIPSNIESELNPSDLDFQDKMISCICPLPLHVKRQEWGAQFGLGSHIHIPPATYTKVTHLIVHHSAGTNQSNNWKAVVASIFDFHVNTNGWQDVGYNWLVDPNGVIYEGRGGGENVRGAHMCGYNSNTMGVCMMGNFELVEPSMAMMEALKKLLAFKACKDEISADGSSNIVSYTGFMNHISGHKEGCALNHTTCPGKHLFSKMQAIRTETKVHIDEKCRELSSYSDFPDTHFSLYPNPAFDYLCIEKKGDINVFNTEGKEFTNMILLSDENCYDISLLPSGLYFITQVYKNQNIYSKFFKN